MSVTRETDPITVSEWNRYFVAFERCHGIEPTDANMNWFRFLDEAGRAEALAFVLPS